jgi:hypothetical protein
MQMLRAARGKSLIYEAWTLDTCESGYEIRYVYDTAPIRRYGKISKIKIRYGWDTLIKKNYITKYTI